MNWSTGLVGDRAQELGDQRPLDPAPHPLGRLDDGRLELGRRHRRDRDGGVVHEGTEALHRERPVVEVRPEGGHDPQAAVGHRHGVHQAGQEDPLVPFGSGGEELFELVDDQQQLPAQGDEIPQDAVDRARVRSEDVGQTRRPGDGDPTEALGQRIEG